MKQQFGILLKSLGVILISLIVSSGNSLAGEEYNQAQVVESEVEEIEESIHFDLAFQLSDFDYSGQGGSPEMASAYVLPTFNPGMYLSSIAEVDCHNQPKKGKIVHLFLLHCSWIVYS